jgi:hypothetical protein
MTAIDKKIASSGIDTIAIATGGNVYEIAKALSGLLWSEEEAYEITHMVLSDYIKGEE